MTEATDAQPERHGLAGLARHSAIYSAAPLLRQVISVAMTYLYTGWLRGPGFGIKETVDLWMIGLQQLLGQNVLGAMVRFYFDREREEDRERVVTSCTLAVGLCAWIACGVTLLFSADLREPMLGQGGEVTSSELLTILRLILIIVPFQLTSLAGFYYLQIKQRSALYTALQTAKFLFEIAMNFWLIGGLGLGVRGFLLSILCGEVLTSALLTGGILIRLGPRVDLELLRPILAYAAPLIPVGLCQFGLHQLDRLLLLKLVDPDPAVAQLMTGVYGLGYKVGFLINAMLLGSFLQVWQPWIFGVRDPRAQARLVARVSTYAVLAIAGATVGVIIFGRQAVGVLSAGPEFLPSWKIVPLVASGYVAWALYQVSQIPLFLAKRTGRLFLANFAALIFKVCLNLWLIPRAGLVGAALATCATFVLLAGLGLLISGGVAAVRFERRRLLRVLLFVAAGVLCTYGIELVLVDSRGMSGLAVAGLKAVLLAAILLGLYFVLAPAERRDLGRWLRRRVVGDEGLEPPTSSL